jgi:hypothetical protein
VCGCILIGLGLACLFFGFPWGALVGAILILAGVIARHGDKRR